MTDFLPSEKTLETFHNAGENLIKNYSSEKMEALIHLCQSKTLGFHHYEGATKRIHSDKLQKIARNYKEYLTLLEDQGILLINNKYIVGEQSKGYLFTPIYPHLFKSHDINRKNKYVDKLSNDNGNNEIHDMVINKLKEYFHFLKLDIDASKKLSEGLLQQREINKEEIFYKKQPTKKSWTVDAETGNYTLEIKRQFKEPLTQYYSEIEAVDRFKNRCYKMGRDFTVFRFHTPLTLLPKIFRPFLSCKKEALVNIDISNSQPFLSLILFNPEFWMTSNMGPRTKTAFHQLFPDIQCPSLINLDTIKMAEYFEKDENLHISILKSISQLGEDFKNYKNEVCAGNIYEYTVDLLAKKLNLTLTRSKAKTLFFCILFTSNSFINTKEAEPKRLFKTLFPTVYNVFAKIKTNRRNYPVDIPGNQKQRKRSALLPILLQRIESFIILDTVCRRIVEAEPNLPIFPIHDSISTPCSFKDKINTIMLEELEKYVGSKPRLNYE